LNREGVDITDPQDKAIRIEADLRGEITRGERVAGDPIPTRQQLIDHYKASSVTVNKALQRLQQQGFVRSRGRLGTFVHETPPHLHRFGVVFDNDPNADDRIWPGLYQLVSQLIDDEFQDENRRLIRYTPEGDMRQPGRYAKLIEDMELSRLGGLVFVNNPGLCEQDWIVYNADIPRVGMTPVTWEKISAIYPDLTALMDEGFKYLASKGCRRVMVVHQVSMRLSWHQLDETWVNPLRASAAKFGIELPDGFTHAVTPRSAMNMRQVLMLMKHLPKDKQPDGLFVTDDRLLVDVLSAMESIDIVPGRDIPVIGHANLPLREDPVPGVARLGYDIHDFLERSIDELIRMRDADINPEFYALLPILQVP